jgi:hypothetical protein
MCLGFCRKLLENSLSLFFICLLKGEEILKADATMCPDFAEGNRLGLEQLNQVWARHVQEVRCLLSSKLGLHWDNCHSIAICHLTQDF